METTISQLQDALAEARGDALTLFRQKIKSSSDFYDEILVLSGRYNLADREYHKDNITLADRKKVFNGVHAALSDLLEKLTDDDLAPPPPDPEFAKTMGLPVPLENDFDSVFKELQLNWRKVNTLQLVDCNRKNEYDAIWEKYSQRQKQGQKFQFFFINACPTQRPEDFAERFILEKLDDLSDEEREAILVNPDPSDSHRLNKEELPFDKRELDGCKKKFSKYFEERFKFEAIGLVPEVNIETCVRQKFEGKKCVTFIFSINASQWNSVLSEYLEWMRDTFMKIENTEGLPEFLFFFVVKVLRLHEGKTPDSLKNALEEMLKMNDLANPKDAAGKPLPPPPSVAYDVIMPLKPIPKDEAILWFTELGKEADLQKIENLLMLTLQRNPTALTRLPRFMDKEKGSIDMLDMVDLQEKLYRYAIKYAA
ncbi:MAG: hypothetical protein ACKVUS_14485 [Saprospiraceae bacterium]